MCVCFCFFFRREKKLSSKSGHSSPGHVLSQFLGGYIVVSFYSNVRGLYIMIQNWNK